MRILFFALAFLIFLPDTYACSGYKITLGNKTILGSNEDAWRVTPHLWFENRKADQLYGAAFTGSRYDGENGYAPQSGMNEMGLAYERLASYHPMQAGFSNRKAITNHTKYLKDILHYCKSVAEVKAYISQYDHSYFTEDVFLYVDKSGEYLVVEPYQLIAGHDPTYVISNFCPSITSEASASRLERYRNGVAFLKKGIDTSLAYCTALSDTMHVCRSKIGDGTLLTSIWDLSAGKVNLFFYHDYSNTIQLSILEELKKGDRLIAIETMFPPSKEFELLRSYKIPKNNIMMGIFIVAAAGLFLLSALFYLLHYFKTTRPRYASLHFLLVPLSLLMCYYMYVLSGKINVYYFPAPYKDPSNMLVSATSYLPFLLGLLIVPMVILNFRLTKDNSWRPYAKGLFTLNNLVYCVLIGLFCYWGFYDVFN